MARREAPIAALTWFLSVHICLAAFWAGNGGGVTAFSPDDPNPNITHIWIIAHTHDDVGWLQTADQYYVNEVQWILDTGVQCMVDSPCYGTKRKYTYVEMAYMYRWWNERPEPIRERLRDIVRNGVLELNLAGWCMNDEAVTTYNDDIDQMTEGALFVHDQIGDFAYPTVGWHIDPFGHSSATASMWADIGFNAFGLNRINFQDKEKRRDNKELEFVWRSSKSRGSDSDIFVHVMADSYSSPPECAIDGGEPNPQNDPTLPTFETNMIEIGASLVDQANVRKPYYRHNHVLIPFGGDFAHQNAYHSFQQMDKIITYINSNASLNATIRYGTFSEYIETLNSLNITWPTYEGDFFPYISGDMQYWTGFYTSRPDIKGLVRSASAVLRVTELLYYSAEKHRPGVLGKMGLEQLGILRRAMATLQHHDAVTGTESDAVAYDYRVQIEQGLNASKLLVASALQVLRSNSTDRSEVPRHADTDNEAGLVVTLYNSLAWPVDVVLSLPINGTKYQVVSESGKPFAEQQIVPTPPYSQTTNNSLYSIYFHPGVVPPLGYRMVRLQPTSEEQIPVTMPKSVQGDVDVSNQYYHLSFNGTTGELSSVTELAGESKIDMNHEFSQYMGAYLETVNSGAYIFNPQPANRMYFPPQFKVHLSYQVWDFPERANRVAVPNDVQWPVVIVSAHAPILALLQHATFTMSTMNTNATTSTLLIYRVDDVGWKQFMGGDYLILDNNGPLGPIQDYWQHGTFEVPAEEKRNCSTVEIKFPTAFSTVPMIFASTEIRGEAKVSPTFALVFSVTVVSLSASSASFNVCNTAGNGWTNTVYLNWLALDAKSKLPATQTMGTSDPIGGPSIGAVAQVNVAFPPHYSVYEASILLSVQAESGRAFAASSGLVTPDGFVANVYPMDGEQGDWTKDKVTVSWFAFQRPDIQYPVTETGPSIEVVEGPLVTEVRQFYRNNYATTTRLYHGDSADMQFIEQDYDIGTLDPGRELVTRFQTSLKTDSCFTDDNGLELINRTFDPTRQQPIAGNYYPLVNAAEIRDEASDQRLAVIADRSHGLGCLGNGKFEVMLQRRTVADDNCGLQEPLNDIYPIRPRLWFLLGKAASIVPLRQKLSLLLQFPVHPIYEPSAVPLHEYSLLDKAFPDAVHLLSLKVRNSTQTPSMFVLRLQNLWQAADSTGHPESITLSLNQTFAAGNCPLIQDETNLTANRLKSSVKRLSWRTNSTEPNTHETQPSEPSHPSQQPGMPPSQDIVTLGTRQMRTFLAT